MREGRTDAWRVLTKLIPSASRRFLRALSGFITPLCEMRSVSVGVPAPGLRV